MGKIIAMIILIFTIMPVNGAIIKGEIYSWELKKIGAVVEINTTPKQRIVAVNGSYEFEVSPGVYEIRAYSIDGKLFCNETIKVTSEGIYIIDLILFPKLESNELDITELDFNLEEEQSPLYPYVIFIAIAGISFVAYFFLIKRRKKVVEERLPDDLERVLRILKEAGGRMTQKELREKLGWSEAKLSLVLADLERRGIIEKYKKGRGNIIFLKG